MWNHPKSSTFLAEYDKSKQDNLPEDYTNANDIKLETFEEYQNYYSEEIPMDIVTTELKNEYYLNEEALENNDELEEISTNLDMTNENTG